MVELGNDADTEKVDIRQWYEAKRKDIELVNCDGKSVPLYTMGRGRSVFLICAGPSLATMPLPLLNRRGIVTMGLNNSPAALAAAGLTMPNLWTCVDTPRHFIEQIWKDPAVMKFAPAGHINTRIKTRNAKGELIDSSFTTDACPNVLYFNRNNRFNPEQFLTQRDFNWGNSENVTDSIGVKGSRSIMLVAVKLLYYLGFKKVYLIGADFKMAEGQQNYAFPQDRTAASVKGNNATYNALNRRFEALRPYFDRAGFEVVNCTPESGLTAFSSGKFEDAIESASKEVMEKPIQTEGHYET